MAAAISLDDAKAYLRILSDDEDVLVQRLIDAAARHIESVYGVVTGTESKRLSFSCFSPRMRIPVKPIDPASLTVTYTDAAGAVHDVTGARLVEMDGWFWLAPPLGENWPASGAVTNVQVDVSAGYAENSAPADVQQAMRILVDHWFVNRDSAGSAPNVDFLIDHYRFRRV